MKYFCILLILLVSVSDQALAQNSFGALLDELVCVEKEIELADSLDFSKRKERK